MFEQGNLFMEGRLFVFKLIEFRTEFPTNVCHKGDGRGLRVSGGCNGRITERGVIRDRYNINRRRGGVGWKGRNYRCMIASTGV